MADSTTLEAYFNKQAEELVTSIEEGDLSVAATSGILKALYIVGIIDSDNYTDEQKKQMWNALSAAFPHLLLGVH